MGTKVIGRGTARGTVVRPRPVVHAPAPLSMRASAFWSSASEVEKRRRFDEAIAAEVLDGILIAIIVPVLGRPQRVRPLLDSFRTTTDPTIAKLYFVAQRSDLAEVAAIRQAGIDPILVGDDKRSWAKKINAGYAATTEPWLLLGADDLRFHAGWIDLIASNLRTHAGVIGTNDLGNGLTARGLHSTHPLVRRTYAKIFGTVDQDNCVVHDGYDHNFPDTELVQTARRRGLYHHRVDCVIEHLHPAWGKAKTDAIYALGRKRMRQDEALFHRRGKVYGW